MVAVPAVRRAREWVEWVTGNLSSDSDWLIDLEFRTQVLEGRREPVTLKETTPS